MGGRTRKCNVGTMTAVRAMREDLSDLLSSVSVLLRRPSGHEWGPALGSAQGGLADAYLNLLLAIQRELDEAAAGGARLLGRRWREVVDDHPDSIDHFNVLVRRGAGRAFAHGLMGWVWDAAMEYLPQEASAEELARRPQVAHALRHVARVLALGVSVPERYMELLRRAGTPRRDRRRDPDKMRPPPRLDPTSLGSLQDEASFAREVGERLTAADVQRVWAHLKARDLFSAGRTFRAGAAGAVPADVAQVRQVHEFYGYLNEKRMFERYFGAFAGGEPVPPLLLAGLPGLGKTHFTIAYTLSHPDLVLVTAQQEQLQVDLERLVATLGRHRYRRFVLFFDDVEPAKLDWSHFRNQVEGYLPYPGNLAIVLASNYGFPATVRSRCQLFEFRPMGPGVCQEMIADYLRQHLGLERPGADLINAVVADYTNEYVNGLLDELTPRSMVRYLQLLEKEEKRRKRIYEEMMLGPVRQPVEELFIAANRRVREQMEHPVLSADGASKAMKAL